ncbi:MAG: BatA domain-containing protein [Gemmatimonadales bacterium]
MSFLAPFWLAAAAIASLGAVALHFITTQRPPASPLPTARFVPTGDARASSRAARPTDLLLLLLRCVTVLLLGTAFAGPVMRARGTALARVIVTDRSRGALPDARDSAALLVGRGDALVLFDSSATMIAAGAQDSLRAVAATHARGSLSAALVGARRAAGDLARRADSVELVIVSPLTADEIDAASANAIAHWPGRVRLVRTKAARATAAAITFAAGAPDDGLRPLIAALNSAVPRAATAVPVRVLRARPLAADSAAARDGAAVVTWPATGPGPVSAQGVWAGDATLVAPLERIALPDPVSATRVVARWADGSPAAVERPLGRGCVRTIGVGVPASGDITLQPAFMGFARVLLAPCAGASISSPVPDSVARRFARGGAAAVAASIRPPDERSPLAPWLLGAALLLLAGELIVRRAPGAVAP